MLLHFDRKPAFGTGLISFAPYAPSMISLNTGSGRKGRGAKEKANETIFPQSRLSSQLLRILLATASARARTLETSWSRDRRVPSWRWSRYAHRKGAFANQFSIAPKHVGILSDRLSGIGGKLLHCRSISEQHQNPRTGHSATETVFFLNTNESISP
jgi:hypothetical protein